MGFCMWFAMCKNEATTMVAHPVLGSVPTCTSCAEFAKDTTNIMAIKGL